VEARATVVAERGEGGDTRCTTLRSSPPITLRETGDGLHLVGSAAGPVGGDDLRLDVTVGPGAHLTVRSVAAQLVYPGPTGALSVASVVATVDVDGALRWLPEPMLLVRGADHRSTCTLDLAARASLVWREEIVLGRADEVPGSLLQRWRVDREGRPLLRNDLAVGPRWPEYAGPAGVGAARVVATTLVVGGSVKLQPSSGVRLAAMPIGPDATLVTALGCSVEAVRAAVVT
jgi:urease accessory protein